MVGNENRLEAPAGRWAEFLEVIRLPVAEGWPQLFRAYRLILRWLVDPATLGLSDYLLLSRARTLIGEVERDLQFAGIPVNDGEVTRDFERFVQDLLRDVLSVDL
jgi:hypothetical protein